MRWLMALAVAAVVARGGYAQSEAPKVTIARWSGDRMAAISLTFDDAMKTQLENVAPILKKHHLNATFFVVTGKDEWSQRKKEWQTLAGEGNEIANHTVNHPCLLKEITPHSQEYTPERMEAEVRDAAAEITKSVVSQRGLTFAYPCGNMSFGTPGEQARNQALFMTYVSLYSFAARGYGAPGTQDPDNMNLLTITDLGMTEGKDFVELLEMAEPGVRGRNWGVFTFHGVGGEWLSVDTSVLEELAGYLEQHSEIWTATFGDAVRYIEERQAASVETDKSGENSMDVRLSWPLDRKVYDLPLTLRVELPSSWKQVNAATNGKALATTIKTGAKSAVALIEVAPGTETVRLTGAN
jgi:peptidoglycan-N-acetylglucosamine deacetylase